VRACLVIAGLLILLGPASAHGQNRAIETGARDPYLGFPGSSGSVAGPFFAGTELVWAEVDPPRRTIAVVAGGPRGRRVIDRHPYEEREFDLDVAEGRVALAEYTRETPPRSALRAGPVAGPLSLVEGTCGVRPFVARAAFGVHCPAVLFHEWAIEVHDAAGVRRYGTPQPDDAQIEGDLIAFHQPAPGFPGADLVVLRRATEEEVLRVKRETGLFDLAADGTVAYTWAYRSRQVRVASPRRPTPKVIGLPFAPDEVRLGGDRIAVRQRDAASPEGQSVSRFAVLERSSGRIVAGHRVRRADRGWDFDGERLAWAEKPCMRAYVMVWDVDRRPPAPPAAACEHARPQGAARLYRSGALSLRFACPAGKRECGGLVHAIVRVRNGAGPGRELWLQETPTIVRDPGERWTETWRLGPYTHSLVRRAREATLEATVTRFGGYGRAFSWGPEPRKHTVPLLR
jgi:hypothetical protein